MPYASLHEAFVEYREHFNSNPDLRHIPQAVPDVATQNDPITAMRALNAAESIKVPTNNTFNAGINKPNVEFFTNNNNNNNNNNNTNNNDCAYSLNHILSCDTCLKKLQKILGVSNNNNNNNNSKDTIANFFGFNITNKVLSKIIFYLIIIIVIVAVYELLSKSFK
jgi:hypothetical protein